MTLLDKIMGEIASALLYPSEVRKKRMRENIEKLLKEHKNDLPDV